MIWVPFFFILSLPLKLFLWLFGLITFELPNAFYTSISFLGNMISYADFLLPVDQLISAFIVYLQFILVWYTLKVLVWVLQHIPVVGKNVRTPAVTIENLNQDNRQQMLIVPQRRKLRSKR